VGYPFVPVAMGVALWAAGRTEDFERFVFTVVAAFLLSYACYFSLPTSGPRVAAEAEPTVLGGSALSAAIRAFLRRVEGNQLDAFPSGHTALSLVYLGAILFSTVYLSLHYVVDLLAGALLAAALPVVVPALGRALGARPGRAAAPPQRPSSKARQRLPAQPMRSNRPSR
jgi:membrane-associated phospholipid phosphatase